MNCNFCGFLKSYITKKYFGKHEMKVMNGLVFGLEKGG